MDNVKQFPNHSAVKDEAAAWVVKLHGYSYKTGHGVPEEKAQELHLWMSQSDFHRETFLKMLGGWDAMNMLEDLADILPLEELQRRRRLSPLLNWWRDLFALPAGLGFVFSGSAVAGLAVVLWLFVVAAPESLEYSTEVGAQASVSLEDGSIIQLNTDSLVQVDYSGARRVVNLVRGEANFDVAKDPSRPFVVYAGDGMVWAVGTAFNVDYRDDYVDVLVSEGTVKVFSGITLRNEEPLLLIDSNSSPLGLGGNELADSEQNYFREVVLDAGESAQYSQSRVIKEAAEEQQIDQELAWQNGVLVFQGETLEQALQEISRYTTRALVIVDPTISEASVGGRFKTDNIDELVNSLALGLDIKTESGSGNSILFSAK